MTPRLRKAKLSHDRSNTQQCGASSSLTCADKSCNVHVQTFELKPIKSESLPDLDAAEREKLLPERLKCRLSILLQDQSWLHGEEFDVYWQSIEQYHSIGKAVELFVQERQTNEDNYFFRSRRICLRRLRDGRDQDESGGLYEEVGSINVTDEREWKETLPRLIARKLLDDETSVFFLEDLWEYERLVVCLGPGINSASVIKQLLQQKQDQNWKKEKFLPQKFYNAIFTEDVIRTLIQQCPVLKKDKEWKDACQSRSDHRDTFVQKVFCFGTHLLAITIYVGLDMSFLYHLMNEKEKQDSDIPRLTDEDFPHGADYDLSLLDFFERCQGSFSPFVFPSLDAKFKHHILNIKDVVPVKFDTKEDYIDGGAFGKVFRVRIHPDHHDLSENRNEYFALKSFSKGDESTEHSNAEQIVLDNLSQVPHKSINPYLASWKQDREFFMLFPLAKCNLRTFLKKPGRPKLTNGKVAWFLDQIFQLADAVGHIHILGPARLGVNNDGGESDDGHGTRTGWHHDLKPENILVFNGDVLKISDFGTAKIHKVLSGRRKRSYHAHNLTHGDAEYGSPDFILQPRKGAGRAYDIWSLGCIFLEIMLWLFGEDNAVENFRAQRTSSLDNPRLKTSVFWYRKETRSKAQCDLKQIVKEKLDFLDRETVKRGFFSQLVSLIRHMLEIKPSHRCNAPEVKSYINALRHQAKQNFQQVDFYAQEQVPPCSELYAPSLTDYPRRGRPGSPATIDTGYVMPHSSLDPAYLSPGTSSIKDPTSRSTKRRKIEDPKAMDTQDQLVAYTYPESQTIDETSIFSSPIQQMQKDPLVTRDNPSFKIQIAHSNEDVTSGNEIWAQDSAAYSGDESLVEDEALPPREATLRRDAKPLPTPEQMDAASLTRRGRTASIESSKDESSYL